MAVVRAVSQPPTVRSTTPPWFAPIPQAPPALVRNRPFLPLRACPAPPRRYVSRDPEMAQTLLDQRQSGKQLLLITNRWPGPAWLCAAGCGWMASCLGGNNTFGCSPLLLCPPSLHSDYHYTHRMMSFAYDTFMPPGQTWRDLFDMVRVCRGCEGGRGGGVRGGCGHTHWQREYPAPPPRTSASFTAPPPGRPPCLPLLPGDCQRPQARLLHFLHVAVRGRRGLHAMGY